MLKIKFGKVQSSGKGRHLCHIVWEFHHHYWVIVKKILIEGLDSGVGQGKQTVVVHETRRNVLRNGLYFPVSVPQHTKQLSIPHSL